MSYNGNLIKLNDKTFSSIINYTITRNKLWGSDTGRNMAGKMEGTLVGNFPKITLDIEPLDDEEMAEIENILDQASINVIYYNNKYRCLCQADFYAGDYDESLVSKQLMMYGKFSVSIIPIESEENHVKLTTTI